MRKTLVLIFVMMLFSLPVYAQNARRDGNWWNQHTAEEKSDYVTGFFDGMHLGHEFSFWEIIDKTKDDNHQSPCLTATMDSYKSLDEKFFGQLTNGQVADGLDVFYKDYRNRSIRVSDGVWVVVNTIAGTSQDKIDSLVMNLRKNAANN